MITRAGTQILLGNMRDLERKLTALELILEELSNRGASAKRIDCGLLIVRWLLNKRNPLLLWN